MHIAFNAFFWDQLHTGSGQYLRGLVSGLREVAPALEITLIMPPHNPVQGDAPEGVNVIQSPGFGGQIGKVWFEQFTYPKIVGKLGADIAHVPYWGSPLYSPVPMVTSVLDVIPLAIADYSKNLTSKMYIALVKASARNSSHTITLSNAAKVDIIKYLGLNAKSITPIYLAVSDSYNPEVDVVRDAEVRKKYDLPDQFVLYLGGFDVRKNVNQVLLAYAHIGPTKGRNTPLVIAGREPEWGKGVFKDLRAYARNLGIEDNVRWIGYVDEIDKPSLYRLARVFVFSSLYEGFGFPLLEAMACGTPAIANDISSMTEVASNGAYLVRPDDARHLAEAILALHLNQETRDAQIAAGFSRAKQFSWTKTARNTLAVYEAVLAKTNGNETISSQHVFHDQS